MDARRIRPVFPRFFLPRRQALLAVLAAACGVCPAAGGAEPAPLSFSHDIQPLLAQHCYKCHGPDAAQRQAELRLDVREEAVKEAIRPGQGAASELLQRIVSQDAAQAMPPAESKLPRLSAAQAELIRRWIDEGAKYDVHWSYVPLPRPTPPPATGPAARWVRQPIDQFIAAGHARQGMAPAREADRVTLLRRLHFDLTGLPPSIETVEAFLADRSPDAYERLVGSLLASPHFGERLAMLWLDLVRYGDTNGYHADLHRNIYPYRDYVIESLNDNKPFDQFTVEQLAGDLLPNPTVEQLTASGYNRLNMTTTEGGAQPKEYLAKYAADRVRNVSMVWLGSTIGCCECHDHKYDPFTTRDFYSLAAFFGDLKQVGLYPNTIAQDPEIKVVSADQASQLATLTERVTALERSLATSTPELQAAQQTWEDKTLAATQDNSLAWQVLTPKQTASGGGATLTLQDDGSALSSGENPPTDIYTVAIELPEQRLTGLRLEALAHPSLSDNRLSRSNGNFVLTEIEAELAPPGAAAASPLKLVAAMADHSQQGFAVEQAIDGKNDTGWAGEGHVKSGDRTAVFTLAEPQAIAAGSTLVVRLKHESIYPQHAIGRFRLSATAADKPSLSGHGLPDAVFLALRVPRDRRTAEQRDLLAVHYRGIAPDLDATRVQLVEAKKAREQFETTLPTTLVSMIGESRETRILKRGNWMDETGEIVSPAVPRFLGSLPAEVKADRLALARWIVSRDNPLTARVFVNRLWKQFFGAGLATSVGDFGAQGGSPSHPEALDWLAAEFIESGWDIKRLVSGMVLSATYRQSSAASAELRRHDPANRWLARQSRWRIDAELVRDNALAIAGLLARKVGGRSVKPYQPEGYWDHCNTFMGKLVYDQDHGEDLYRRGMYTYWKRTFLHPSLSAFDAPSHEECTAERTRSSTPLQALILLNDPTYVEASRVFAEKIMREGGASPVDRIQFACKRALSRPAQPSEVNVLTALYWRHQADFSADAEGAVKLISTGEAPVGADLPAAELAAWTSVARTILNLHETVTRP